MWQGGASASRLGFLIRVPQAQLNQIPFQGRSQSFHLQNGDHGPYLDVPPGGCCEEGGRKAERDRKLSFNNTHSQAAMLLPALPPPQKRELSPGTSVNCRPARELTS